MNVSLRSSVATSLKRRLSRIAVTLRHLPALLLILPKRVIGSTAIGKPTNKPLTKREQTCHLAHLPLSKSPTLLPVRVIVGRSLQTTLLSVHPHPPPTKLMSMPSG